MSQMLTSILKNTSKNMEDILECGNSITSAYSDYNDIDKSTDAESESSWWNTHWF